MKKQVHRKGRKLELQTETVKKLVRIDDNQLEHIAGGVGSDRGCTASGRVLCANDV